MQNRVEPRTFLPLCIVLTSLQLSVKFTLKLTFHFLFWFRWKFAKAQYIYGPYVTQHPKKKKGGKNWHLFLWLLGIALAWSLHSVFNAALMMPSSEFKSISIQGFYFLSTASYKGDNHFITIPNTSQCHLLFFLPRFNHYFNSSFSLSFFFFLMLLTVLVP